MSFVLSRVIGHALTLLAHGSGRELPTLPDVYIISVLVAMSPVPPESKVHR